MQQSEPTGPVVMVAVATEPAAGDDTTELPIYREIEAAWFRTHGNTTGISVYTPAVPKSEEAASGPQAGQRPTTPSTPQPAPQPVSLPVSQSVPAATQRQADPAATGAMPTRPTPIPVATTQTTDRWRTKADDGWRAAAAAAEPTIDEKTRSGLPKRSPGAQLVPGGVDSKVTARNRRTPEEVRGLLSTYQRGVQRGRKANSGSDVGTPGTAEGSGQ